MKKYVSRLVVFMMIIMMIPTGAVFGETKPELEIISTTKPTYEINENDVVMFGMVLKNNTEGNITDITVGISGGFIAINEDSTRKLKDIRAGGELGVEPFNLRYNGGKETEIIVTLTYKVGGAPKARTVQFNTKAAPSNPDENRPNNTKVYKPELTVVNGDQPVIKGENKTKVAFVIKNKSGYEAKNIKVTGAFSSSKFELAEVSPTKQKENMEGDSEFTVTYEMKGKAEEKSGVYPLGIKATFTNIYGDEFTNEFEVFIKYIADEAETNVDVVEQNEKQNVISGEEFDFGMEIKNLSPDGISDVVLTLVELDGTKIINKYTNSKRVEKIEAGKSANVSFKMVSNEKLATGNYPVKAELKFKDVNGREKKITKTFYKKIQLTNSELFIDGIKSNEQVLEGNDTLVVTVPVVNYGEKKAEKVKVFVSAAAGLINTSSSSVIIPEIPAGEKKEVSFEFKVSPKVTEGNKAVTVKVTEGETSIESSLNVYTEGVDKETESAPKIIISKYSSDPLMVKAGEEFDLNLAFLNSHFEKTVRNIKITLTTSPSDSSDKTGSVFTPVNSSNTFFIDTINPKSTADMSIKLYTIPDAKSKTYSIDVKMEYEDLKGNKYNATDLIGIPVRQQAKYMISDIKVPENSEIGRPIRMDLTISNTGKIDLMNFTVKIEGDFTASNSQTYVGSITPGNREYYDVDLIPTKEGLNTGTFIFSYEDTSGKIVEEKREVSSTAAQPYIPEFNPDDMKNPNGNLDPTQPKKGFPVKWVVIGGGVLVLLVVVVVLRKKAKKKKEMELDE